MIINQIWFCKLENKRVILSSFNFNKECLLLEVKPKKVMKMKKEKLKLYISLILKFYKFNENIKDIL